MLETESSSILEKIMVSTIQNVTFSQDVLIGV